MLCFAAKIRKIGIPLHTLIFLYKSGVYISLSCFPDVNHIFNTMINEITIIEHVEQSESHNNVFRNIQNKKSARRTCFNVNGNKTKIMTDKLAELWSCLDRCFITTQYLLESMCEIEFLRLR